MRRFCPAGSGSGAADSSATVYGCRIAQQRFGRPALHDPSQVHHCHPMRDLSHDREVVGDEQVGEASASLEVHQQVETGPAP